MKPAAALLAVACYGSVLLAQQGVNMFKEPHHALLTYIRNMRVFDVNVAAKEMTLDHIHDHDTATVVLSPAMTRTQITGQEWTAPRDRALDAVEINMYTGAAITHKLENVGGTPYRIYTVENMRDSGWTAPKPIQGPGVTLLMESRAFAIYDIKLGGDTMTTMHVHENPAFVVVLSGAIQVQAGGGEAPFKLDMRGRWFPSSGADQPHGLTAVGGDARVLDIEAR